eukprot:TRINITY_DN9_c1_g1_i1.p1 TRINITY_DN9_c1_g1~~TRINITY_DN9_c1_g1_i1.p1  ORF type:complete len:345 (+),score=128.70 TRINITY_DN9_c1_g1_i1:88-1122(+)
MRQDAIAGLPCVLSRPTSEYDGVLGRFAQLLFPGGTTPAPPIPSEMWTAVLFFLLWAVVRKCSFTYILLPSVRKAGAPEDGVHDYKCAVLFWNGAFHTASTLWLYMWLPWHRWYWDTSLLWENSKNGTQVQPMELEFKVFYMLQLGYHIQSIVWHAIEERRPDFLTMVVHHVVTIALIVGSWYKCYVRIGMLVLLVHDASDVFVCACKATHMCGMKKASHVLFVVMFFSWLYYRLWLYPTWVIYSVSTFPDIGSFAWSLFTGLMIVLLCLHIWWFHLFVKMAVGIFKYSEGKDLTETKEAQESAARDESLKRHTPPDPQVAAEEGRSFAAKPEQRRTARQDVPP